MCKDIALSFIANFLERSVIIQLMALIHMIDMLFVNSAIMRYIKHCFQKVSLKLSIIIFCLLCIGNIIWKIYFMYIR